jgi:hypothetical protein
MRSTASSIFLIPRSRWRLEVGDTLEIWVHYGDATVNLHRRMYGIRNGEVEEILKLQGCPGDCNRNRLYIVQKG